MLPGAWFAQPVYADSNPNDSTRIVVGLEGNHDHSQVLRLAKQYGATVLRIDDTLNFAVFSIPNQGNLSAQSIQNALESEQSVRFVENDAQVTAAFSPNDPDYNNASKVYGPQQINAAGAWNYSLGAPNVTIAVIDTGIDQNHPEFSGRILPGWDFVNDDADASDDQGHGTHVAGIIAAGVNNGIGIAGMAGGSKILPVKVLNEYATGYWSNVASGITWAVDQGAQIINLSLGGSIDSPTLHSAVDYAVAHNVVVVAASGNNGSDSPFYPAVYDTVIAVAATTQTGQRWTLSNFGPNVDVMAPGATVYSTYWNASIGSTYQFMSGTSMASPHVAGLVALMLSVNPDLLVSEIENALQSTATDIGDPGIDSYYGYGLINAPLAMQAAMQSTYSVGGMVFYDWNQNQIVDFDDTGIDLVELCLYRDVNDNATLDDIDQQLMCQSTASTGEYSFEGLAAGAYLVTENQPSNFCDTTPNVQAVTLGDEQTGGQAGAAVNFGDYVYSTATGMIFLDSNGSGVQDPGETIGVSGIPVTATNLVTLEVFTTITDAGGAYTFDTLLPGTYALTTPQRIEGLAQTTLHTQQIVVGIDETVAGSNFGFITPTSVQLADFTATVSVTGTKVKWGTVTEKDQTAFVIWRAVREDGQHKAVSGLIAATNDPNGADYAWTDTGVDAGSTSWYMLQSLPDGTFFGPIPASPAVPAFTAVLFAPVVLR